MLTWTNDADGGFRRLTLTATLETWVGRLTRTSRPVGMGSGGTVRQLIYTVDRGGDSGELDYLTRIVDLVSGYRPRVHPTGSGV